MGCSFLILSSALYAVWWFQTHFSSYVIAFFCFMCFYDWSSDWSVCAGNLLHGNNNKWLGMNFGSGTTQKLLHTPVVCDRRWWWPLNAKWVCGLAMQTVNWVLTTQTFADYLSGNDCFLCRDFKNLCGCDDWFCYITAKFVGFSNKLSRPVVVILERKKRNFFTWEFYCLLCGI